MPTKYAGADWLRRQGDYTVSDFGAKVADLLGELYYGLYHLDRDTLRKCNWDGVHHVCINVYSGGFATFDFSELTRFVVLCHDVCIRGEIKPVRNGYFRLMFHPREREGGMSERHPTIEDHIAKIRGSSSTPASAADASATEPGAGGR